MRVRGLSKTYRTKGGEIKALEGVTFDLPERGMVFVLGRSGSGKSTLLNLLSGLDKADEGSVIEVCGKDIVKSGERERNKYRNSCCGFVFQEYNLIPELNIAENVELSLALQGSKENGKAVEQALSLVGLEGYGARKTTELSGGQKQRVAIARALIKRPEIVFADEPTGALDESTGAEIFEILKSVSRDRLVVVVSHDRAYAQKYGDRIIELSDGRVVNDSGCDYEAIGGTEREYTAPKLPIKTAFKIGCANFKQHPIRLVATLLLCVIAFTLLGVSVNIAFVNAEKNFLRAMQESDMEYISVYKHELNENVSASNSADIFDKLLGLDTRVWVETPVTQSDKALFREAYDAPMFCVHNSLIVDYQHSVTMNLRQLYEETLYDDKRFALFLDGIMNIGYDDCAGMGFTITGRLPESKDEVAINESVFNLFAYGGMTVDGVNYAFDVAEDILGFEISVEHFEKYGNGGGIAVKAMPLTIVGVVNTGCSKACEATHNEISEHPHSKMFVSEDYVSFDKYAVFAINDHIEDLANLIFDYEVGGIKYTFFSTRFRYNAVKDYLSIYQALCLYLSIIFLIVALILLADYISTSVRKQMKQIGILSAVGADFKSLVKVYGSVTAVICAVVWCLSLIFGSIFISVLNNYIVGLVSAGFEAVCFNFALIPLLLAATGVCGILGIIVPLMRVRKLSPIDAVNKGQIK